MKLQILKSSLDLFQIAVGALRNSSAGYYLNGDTRPFLTAFYPIEVTLLGAKT